MTSFVIPSWMQWPPNCCETCAGWNMSSDNRWIGVCNDSASLDQGSATDARYRCPAFTRKTEKVQANAAG
jgi:hypothetical protein